MSFDQIVSIRRDQADTVISALVERIHLLEADLAYYKDLADDLKHEMDVQREERRKLLEAFSKRMQAEDAMAALDAEIWGGTSE